MCGGNGLPTLNHIVVGISTIYKHTKRRRMAARTKFNGRARSANNICTHTRAHIHKYMLLLLDAIAREKEQESETGGSSARVVRLLPVSHILQLSAYTIYIGVKGSLVVWRKCSVNARRAPMCECVHARHEWPLEYLSVGIRRVIFYIYSRETRLCVLLKH